eukprot:3297080-Karenia_brevis.AAC.1
MGLPKVSMWHGVRGPVVCEACLSEEEFSLEALVMALRRPVARHDRFEEEFWFVGLAASRQLWDGEVLIHHCFGVR